jgi:hypothetical protein
MKRCKTRCWVILALMGMLCIVWVSCSKKKDAPLRLEGHKFLPGAQIKVHFIAPRSFAQDAWIGIVPSDISHGSEALNDEHDIDFQYLKKKTSGTLIFNAPGKVGSYDFRMHDTDDNGREIASVSFKVTR